MSSPADECANKIREKKKRFLAREQCILDNALVLLLNLGMEKKGRDNKAVEKGIEKITVSSIAKQAGVGKGTVYKHFLTKSEILMRLVFDYEHNLATRVREGAEQAFSGEPTAIARAYLEARLGNPALDRLMQKLCVELSKDPDVSESMAELKALKQANVEEMVTAIRLLIKRGSLQDMRPEHYYFALWSFAQGVVSMDTCPALLLGADVDDKPGLLSFFAGLGINLADSADEKAD